ncbi:MAG: DUF3761 domain-containing protein, partial [Gemmatimonadaceae bacterium]
MTHVRLFSHLALAAAFAAPLAARAQGNAKTKGSVTPAMAMPAAATGRCGDGTWSAAANQQGACSSHGGVAKWFGAA